jgi:hypothetical protein
LIFYICISLYLFGDLAIYGTAVPKTLRDLIWFVNEHLVCSPYRFSSLSISTYEPINCTNSTIDDPCFESLSLTRHRVYQILVVSRSIFRSCQDKFIANIAQGYLLFNVGLIRIW